MPKKPEILSQNLVCQSRLFRVEELSLRFSNGEERIFERLVGSGGGAVIVVPMLDANTVVMIREYGAGVEDYELTLPKGRVEPGEDVLDAANREIKEEIGMGARVLTPIKQMTQSPNYMAHRTQLILAQDLYPERLEGDEPEPLETENCSLTEITDLVLREDLNEARSIAALYMAKDFLCTQSEGRHR